MDALRNWVLQIAAIVAFIVLIEIMLPSGRLKKVIELVLGFILIISILNPLAEVFKGRIDMDALMQSAEYDMDRMSVRSDSGVLEEIQMRQVLDVYKNRVIGNIAESASILTGIDKGKISADIVVDEETGSQDFGMIRHIFIEFSDDLVDTDEGGVSTDDAVTVGNPSIRDDTAQTGIRRVEIKPVRIDPVTGKSRTGNNTALKSIKVDQSAIDGIKERLSSMYAIDKESITITF